MEKQSTRKLFMLVIAVVSLFLLCMSAFMLTSCGEDEEHVHSYDDGVVTTAATCTATGVKTFTCECGAVKYETIEALGHDWGDEVTTAATCTVPGSVKQQCSVCYAEKTLKTIAALGHDYALNAEKSTAPTCLVAGSNVYVCKNCGGQYSEPVPVLEHNWEEIEGPQSAYAILDGEYTFIKSTTNITSFSPNDLYAKTEAGEYVHILCTATATNVRKCTECGSTETIETKTAFSHSWNLEGKAATCTEPGYSVGSKCEVCGNIRTAATTSPLGHAWERADYDQSTHSNCTLIDSVASTCTVEGYATYQCNYCNEATMTEELALVAHTLVSEVTKQPTCTEKGETTYTCSVCGYTYKMAEPAALGHVNYYVAYNEQIGAKSSVDVIAKYLKVGTTDGEYDRDTETNLLTPGGTDGEDYYSEEKWNALNETFSCQWVVICLREESVSRGAHDAAGAVPTCRTGTTCVICGAQVNAKKDHSLIEVSTLVKLAAQTNTDLLSEQEKALVAAYNQLKNTEFTVSVVGEDGTTTSMTMSLLSLEEAKHNTKGTHALICQNCLLAAYTPETSDDVDNATGSEDNSGTTSETVIWTMSAACEYDALKEIGSDPTYNCFYEENVYEAHEYKVHVLKLDVYDALAELDTEADDYAGLMTVETDDETDETHYLWEEYEIADADCVAGFVLIAVCQSGDCDPNATDDGGTGYTPTILVTPTIDGTTVNTDATKTGVKVEKYTWDVNGESYWTDNYGFFNKTVSVDHVLKVAENYQDFGTYKAATCSDTARVVYQCVTCGSYVTISLSDYLSDSPVYDYSKVNVDDFNKADYANGEAVYYTGADENRHGKYDESGKFVAADMKDCGLHCDLCATDGANHTSITLTYLISAKSELLKNYTLWFNTSNYTDEDKQYVVVSVPLCILATDENGVATAEFTLLTPDDNVYATESNELVAYGTATVGGASVTVYEGYQLTGFTLYNETLLTSLTDPDGDGNLIATNDDMLWLDVTGATKVYFYIDSSTGEYCTLDSTVTVTPNSTETD